MNRALFAAASGMSAEQQHLDMIAANLSNADVAAFSGKMLQMNSVLDGAGRVSGVRVAGSRTDFAQGKLEISNGPCDLALRGPGFFCVQRGHEVGYTRAGSFHRDTDGFLVNGEGWHLAGIRIPENFGKLAVASDGRVTLHADGGDDKENARIAGRILIAQFPNQGALRPLGTSVFAATAESGKAQFVHAGAKGSPDIAFGMLERSSVSIIEAMMEILDAQRAYEADAKGVQAADELVRIANNLQRG